MWRWFLIVSFMVFCLSLTWSAEQKIDATVVVAEGVGATADEALKDAFRNAVRQVVGAVVDAETLVKQDQIISDKVLTYSSGFVKKYDEISKTQEKGLIRVKISAQVERRDVVAKLQTAKVAVKELDGKGLAAEIITKLEAEKNAKELVAKSLEGFPYNLLKAEAVGSPNVINKSDTGATIRVQIRVRADMKEYDKFAESFGERLGKVATEKGQGNLAFLDKGTTLNKGKVATKEGPNTVIYERYLTFAPLKGSSVPSWRQMIPKAFEMKEKKYPVVLVVNTKRNQTGLLSEWKYFFLDDSVKEVLTSTEANKPTIAVSLVDGDGKAIVTGKLSSWDQNRNLRNEAPRVHLNLMSRDKDFNIGNTEALFIIAPFSRPVATSYPPFIDGCIISIEFTLTLEQLKSVTKVQCEVGK